VYFRLEVVSTKTSHRRVVKLRPYHFFRSGSLREIQFFDDFLEFIEMSGVRALDKPLFSRLHPVTGTYAEAQGRMFREALKTMAVHFHLDPNLYSGKSTRRGGTTSMQMSDRPDSDMLTLTGHANLSTTVGHYVMDVGHRGNTFRNSDDGQVSLSQLKRSLPSSYRVPKGPIPVAQVDRVAPGLITVNVTRNDRPLQVCLRAIPDILFNSFILVVLFLPCLYVDNIGLVSSELLRDSAP
jgi:hypothetical protein